MDLMILKVLFALDDSKEKINEISPQVKKAYGGIANDS